jgi:formate hydrogenlyase subunit 4
MIHEVMVLDHSGPDFGLIELGAFSKLFLYSAFIARLICPFDFVHPALDVALFAAAVLLVYIAVGLVESVMARYRMDRVPKFVLTSFALVFFAAVITLEFAK